MHLVQPKAVAYMNEPRISLIFAYQAFEIVTVLGSKECCCHSNYAKVNRVP